MPRPGKRDEIVETALALFARDGFHATGVDRIVEDAGISKKTLYAHFGSKDDLVVAVLDHYDRAFREDFVQRVESAARSPRARLLAIFDVARDWFDEKRFYGCLFVNAIGEHSSARSPVRRVCQGFKGRMRDYVGELVAAAGLRPRDAIADELALLLEGAIVTAQVSGRADAAQTAKRTARRVIEAGTAQK